jgi:tyrosine-protein phosphatase YwqE
MSKEIKKLTETYLTDPVQVSVTPENSTVDKIEQSLMHLSKQNKSLALQRIISSNPKKRVIVFSRTKHGSDKLVKWLMAKNIIPIIAHPERNRDVQKNIAVLKPFIQMGCLFQITGSSLLGAFGDICVTRSKELLEMGVIHFIASDAHNLKRRPPMLAEAVDVAKTVISDVEANKLVYDNPAMLIELV